MSSQSQCIKKHFTITLKPIKSLFLYFFRKHWIDLLIVIIVFSIAFTLRFINLEGWPRWYTDEGIYGESGKNLYKGIIGIKGYEPNPGAPLYPIISGALTTIFGSSMFLLRIISVIFGTLTCIMVYFIAKKAYSIIAGIVAGVFLAISYNAIYLDRMGFNPALFNFFVSLTILAYIYASETGSKKWTFMLGFAGGCTGLAKLPQGGFGVIFPLAMVLIERKYNIFKKALPVIVSLLSIYVILSFINDFYLYWKTLIGFAQGPVLWPMDFQALLRNLLLAHPIDQLRPQELMYHVGLWTFLGFISVVYLSAKHDHYSVLLIVAFSSLLLTLLITKIACWWILLVGFLPIYSVAIGCLSVDFIKNEKTRITILPLILLSGLAEWGFMHPSSYGFKLTKPLRFYELWNFENYLVILAVLIFIIGIFALRRSKNRNTVFILKLTKFSHFRTEIIAQFLAVTFIVIIMVVSFKPVLNMLTQDASYDQRAALEWINKQAERGDLISVPLTLIYLVKSDVIAVEPEYVCYYNTGIPGPRIFLGRPLTIEAPLDKVKYFVVDTSFTGASHTFIPFVREIEALWELVYAVGDFRIFRNPGLIKVVHQITVIDEFSSQGTWKVVDGTSNTTLKVVDAKNISDTPSSFKYVAMAIYDREQEGVQRFRFLRETPFNLKELSERKIALRIWIYGDGSEIGIEIAWRDKNEFWKRLNEQSIVCGLTWTGWKMLQIPIEKDAPQQEGFDETQVLGLEVNVLSPGDSPITSTIFIGPAEIVEILSEE